MANGDLIKLGTLYLSGAKAARPTRPWKIDTVPPGALATGDIPSFVAGQAIEIRDTDSSEANKLQWREVSINGKKLLVADRNLLANISWNDLNDQSLVFGKTVTIDGQQYKLRLLTGGNDQRGSVNIDGGKPVDNEWDRIISNESNFSGLPVPVSSDLDGSTDSTDFSSTHNQFWNWYFCNSWVQETHVGNSSLRILRGLKSARYFDYFYSPDRSPAVGWRPVLEVLNAAPTVALNTADKRTLYENDVFTIDGSASDSDNGNIVNVKYSLDGGTVRALATGISTGANAISFAKSLTFKGGKLYDGETVLTEALSEGTAHTLRVMAEDDQGGKSAEQTRTFYVVANRPPALTIDAFTPKSSLINSDKVTLAGSVSDPENQTVIVKYKIGSGNFIEVYNGANGAFSFDIKLADLQAGENQITIQAVDTFGATASKIVKLNKATNATKLLDGVQRYKVQPPKGTAKGLVMWVQAETGDLTVSANVSMTSAGVQEDFKAMTLSNTAPVSEGVVEYEFTYQTETAQENVVVELRLHRNNAASTAAVTLVSGVLL